MICSVCGEEFKPKKKTSKYCSPSCYWTTLKGKSTPITGKHHTPETRAKIKAKRALQVSSGMKGKTHTPEVREKIRAIHLGRKQSEAERLKRSVANKNSPKLAAQLEKLHESLIGHSVSENTRKKISEMNVGHPVRSETREKLRAANVGKKKSPETIAKISGENSSAWKGGISFEPYCPKFTKEFKERVRAFFGYKCQMPGCGHIWQPGEKKLAVHHVNFRKDACCADDVIPLFVPVCSGKCHAKTNSNRPHWERVFTQIINEQYGGICYLPKEKTKEVV
jgi:hypothetical protein